MQGAPILFIVINDVNIGALPITGNHLRMMASPILPPPIKAIVFLSMLFTPSWYSLEVRKLPSRLLHGTPAFHSFCHICTHAHRERVDIKIQLIS